MLAADTDKRRNILREVTSVRLGKDGAVLALENRLADWSPRSAADAMLDIELGEYVYLARWPERRTIIEICGTGDHRRLMTARIAHRASDEPLPNDLPRLGDDGRTHDDGRSH